MTGVFYILLEVLKFLLTWLLKVAPKRLGFKVKAKNYVLLVEFMKLVLVILVVVVVPYVAPNLTNDKPIFDNTVEVQQ